MKSVALHFLSIFILLIFTGCNSGLTIDDMHLLSGSWQGRANDFNTVKRVDSLHPCISLSIADNGKARAKVGSASISNATVVRNRCSIERFLKLKTDYLIEGVLNGQVNFYDTLNYVDQKISIPFNVINDTLRGTLFVNKPWEYPLPVIPKLELVKSEKQYICRLTSLKRKESPKESFGQINNIFPMRPELSGCECSINLFVFSNLKIISASANEE